MPRWWNWRCAIGLLVLVLVTPAVPSASVAGSAVKLPGDPSGAQSHRDAGSLFVRALHLEHGEGVAQNLRQALGLYCEAGALGEPRAYLNIGWMYLNGRGVHRNDAVASAWLHKAAESGVAEARSLLHLIGSPAPAKLPNCGQLTRTISTYALPTEPPAAPAEIRALIESIAPGYGLDTNFVTAVIATESAFHSNAVSPKRAMGLMQLMPETAARFGVEHPFDPAENIRGGASYLKWLLDRYAGNIDLALAAYNAGESAVEAYGGIPPYPETQQYVARVESIYGGTMSVHTGLRIKPPQPLK
jgi:Transglycosylase SLT domain